MPQINLHTIKKIIKENSTLPCAKISTSHFSSKPGTVVNQAQRTLYFCVVWVPAPKTAWSTCKAGCSQQRGAGAAGLSCAACRMLSALGQSRWKQSQLLFYLLAFISGCVDKHWGTVFTGKCKHSQAARRALLLGRVKESGVGKVSGCVLCQGTFSTCPSAPRRAQPPCSWHPGLCFPSVFGHGCQHPDQWIKAQGGCSAGRQLGGQGESFIFIQIWCLNFFNP